MCLDIVNQEKSVKQYIRRHQQAGVEYVKVYKFCELPHGRERSWIAFYWYTKFSSKLNVCKDQFNLRIQKGSGAGSVYPVGFHSYFKSPTCGSRHIVTCWVPLDSIVAIGYQGGERVVVSKKIYMPKYPAREIECPK